jgi:8-hydroxy-5-deazaflavin:NADPH oxidoreductase
MQGRFTLKIGIIGAGNIGGSLGKVWSAKGHEIVFGVRDINSPKTQAALAEIGGIVRAVSIPEAAAWGEVIVLAVPWAAVRETVVAMGDVKGKIIIDATNRISPVSPEDEPSAAQAIAKWSPGARVVKAFNTMGWESLLNPVFSGHPVTTFVCGDDGRAKETVMKLAEEIGIQAVDAGTLANAGAVEAVARLWVSMMRSGMGRDFAFTMIHR